jgi:hypothetical protein
MDLLDVQSKRIEEVKNICHLCGAVTYKARLLPNAVCFDCKQKNNRRYADKAYVKKYSKK